MTQIGPYRLFDKQERAVDRVRRALGRLEEGRRRVVLVSPTGSGKTIMGLALMFLTAQKGNRAAFITSGRQLVLQMARTCEAAGLPATVLMSDSGYDYNPAVPVQVISKDTLEARLDRIPFTPPDLWVVDEADVSMSPGWLDLLRQAPFVVGLTATPCLGDGRGLGGFYGDMVEAASFPELIADGTLVDIPEGGYFCPYRPDLTGAPTSGNDYPAEWLSQQMNRDLLVGNVVTSWKRHGQNRPTVVFCVDVAHSVHTADLFNGAGILAEHIDGTTPQSERDAIFERLRDGRIQVVTNCSVLDRGWNEPCISCGVLAKPTRRLRTYLQMVGRLVRSHPGKKDAIVIDHAGAIYEHGWPTDRRAWSLDPETTVEQRDFERRARDRKEIEPRCCPECAAMWTRGAVCPHCGHRYRRRGRAAQTVDGRLAPTNRGQVKRATDRSDTHKMWMQILGQCANSGRHYMVAATRFKKETGMWPEKAGVRPTAEFHQRKVSVAKLWPGFVRKKKA